MPEFFTNFAQPQQRNSLADMVNMASGLQQFQQAQQLLPIQLEKAQMELQQLKQTQPLELKRLGAEAKVAEETAAPRISKSLSEAEVANINKFKAYLNNSISAAAPLLEKKDLSYADIEKHFKDSLSNLSDDPKLKQQAFAQAMQHIPKNASSDELKIKIAQQQLQTLESQARINKIFPEYEYVDTAEAIVPMTKGSAVSYEPAGIVKPGGIEKGIPPTQQVMSPEGVPRMIGPVSQRGGPQSLQTGVGPAQQGLLQAGSDIVKNDWTNTTFDAQSAPGRIAIYQNIKKLVPESFTGVGGERKQVLSGIAQAVGIPANILETSSTDELLKNTKLLQLGGGTTDAARGIAELANPNTKMTKEGILRVTNQLIAIEKMKEAKARYLQPYTQNAAQYQQAMLNFKDISDPRLFQEMSEEEFKKAWSALSQKEKTDLVNMQRKAKQLGVIQ